MFTRLEGSDANKHLPADTASAALRAGCARRPIFASTRYRRPATGSRCVQRHGAASRIAQAVSFMLCVERGARAGSAVQCWVACSRADPPCPVEISSDMTKHWSRTKCSSPKYADGIPDIPPA
jgi:hypothetical protein